MRSYSKWLTLRHICRRDVNHVRKITLRYCTGPHTQQLGLPCVCLVSTLTHPTRLFYSCTFRSKPLKIHKLNSTSKFLLSISIDLQFDVRRQDLSTFQYCSRLDTNHLLQTFLTCFSCSCITPSTTYLPSTRPSLSPAWLCRKRICDIISFRRAYEKNKAVLATCVPQGNV